MDIDQRLRNTLSEQIQQDFHSLPGIVCQDFFGRCSSSLIPRELGPRKTQKRSIRVSCEWDELVEEPSSGLKKHIRRKLSKVCEEEAQSESATSSGPTTHSPSSMRHVETNTRGPKGQSDDFRLFVRAQEGLSNNRDKRLILYQSGSTRKNRASKPRKVNTIKNERQVKCYELFCIHESNLLVHRNQILTDAEKLARRLFNLTSNKL